MKKKFLIEKFITILILFRTHLRELPLVIFLGIVGAMYFAKYKKEGFTYTVGFLFLGTLLTVAG